MKRITVYFVNGEEKKVFDRIVEMAKSNKRSYSKQTYVLLKEVLK